MLTNPTQHFLATGNDHFSKPLVSAQLHAQFCPCPELRHICRNATIFQLLNNGGDDVLDTAMMRFFIPPSLTIESVLFCTDAHKYSDLTSSKK